MEASILDLGGFVASTLKEVIRINIPTTLLSMVNASVGIRQGRSRYAKKPNQDQRNGSGVSRILLPSEGVHVLEEC